MNKPEVSTLCWSNRKRAFLLLLKSTTGTSLLGLSFLTSCFDDLGFLKQQHESEAGETQSSEVLQNSDGILVAKVVASSQQVQLIQASEDSNISGSSLTVPPGSFSIDTEISVQEGASLVSDTLNSELGLDQDQQLTLASPAVVVSTSEEVELNQPFTLSIALSSSSLRLFSDLEYTVIYKIQKSGENGAYSIGVIPSELLTISAGKAIFQAQFFGSYQVASSPKKITEAKEISVTSPILTVEAAKTLPEIAWTMDEPDYQAADRLANFSASAQNLKEPYFCHVFVDTDMVAPWELVAKTGAITQFSAPGKSSTPHERYARFVCTDETGRTSSSPWSKAAKFLNLSASAVGLPANITITQQTVQGSVSGLGVVKYRYALVNATDADCAKETYGAWQEVSTPLALTMSSDGAKTLCLQGQDLGQNMQIIASKYQWQVDQTPPGSFALNSPAAFVNISSPIAQWSAAAGAAHYVLMLSQQNTCTATLLNTKVTATSYPLSNLAPGSYFLCLEAVDAVGNVAKAANSPFAFTIDTSSPQVSSISTSLADGIYPAGTSIPIAVTFSEAVSLGANNGGLALKLETGSVDGEATYVSGSGTNTLLFSYVVQVGDTSADLGIHGTAPQLVLSGTQSLSDLAGNQASLAISGNPLGAQHEIGIDGNAPTASMAGYPVSLSGPTNLNVSVYGSDVVFYRYKLGGATTTDCSVAANYSADQTLNTSITANTSSITDSIAKLCVVGRDQVGNWQSLANATSATWSHDGLGPTPGNSGLIALNYKTESSMTLTWLPATDSSSTIEYKIVYSYSNNIQTIAEAQTNGTVLTNWASYPSPFEITGLQLGEERYFNILVRDGLGSVSAYQAKLVSLPNKVGGIGRAFRTVKRSQDGTRLYAVDNHNKLHIYDLANPASPALLGSLNGFYYAREIVEYDSNNLLIADGYAGLKAVNITNPANPSLINTIAMPLRPASAPGYAEDVVFNNNYVFATDPGLGVATFNAVSINSLSIATEPTLASLAGVTALALSGNHLLLNAGSSLQIFDVTTSGSFSQLGTVSLNSQVNDIIIDGNRAFVACNNGFKVIDIIIGNNPPMTIANQITAAPMFQGEIFNNKIYFASGQNGTFIYNSASPFYNLANSSSSYARAVAPHTNFIYVADQSDGLAVVDITSSSPDIISWIGGKPGSALKVVKSGDYAFIADSVGGLTVVDVSDPAFPITVFSDPMHSANDLRLVGDTLYVAAGSDGLIAYDVTNPESPQLISSYSTNMNAQGMHIAGNLAFVANGTYGLKILNISNVPMTLVKDSTYYSSISNVALNGNFAYVSAGAEGVGIFDISNPTGGIPSVGTISNGITPVKDVKISGSKIFVASSLAGNGFFVFDLASDPAVPALISTPNIQLPYVTKIESIGNSVYLFAGKTMKVLDISNPTLITAVGSYTSPGYLYGIAIDNGLAYLANYEYGLSIMEHLPGMPPPP